MNAVGHTLLTAIQELQMNQEPTTAQWLSDQQTIANVSDQELADAMGYRSANVIGMLKAGQMRVPLNKVPQLASALNISPASLLRRLLQDADPGLLHVVELCMGALCLSDGEQQLIEAIRKADPGNEPVTVTVCGEAIVTLVVV